MIFTRPNLVMFIMCISLFEMVIGVGYEKEGKMYQDMLPYFEKASTNVYIEYMFKGLYVVGFVPYACGRMLYRVFGEFSWDIMYVLSFTPIVYAVIRLKKALQQIIGVY